MEIEKLVIKVPLDFSKTIDYFLDHIESNCVLGKMIAEKVSLKSGRFDIFLPKESKPDRIYKFAEGGINPANSSGEVYHIEGREFAPNQRITTYFEVSAFIKQILDCNKEAIAICEDATRVKGNLHLVLPNIGLHFFEDQVYYSLSYRNSIDEIYNMVRRSDSVWHSLIVIAKNVQLNEELQSETISDICGNIDYIFTSAHDSENLIIWKNNF